jgi:hypothetical protein
MLCAADLASSFTRAIGVADDDTLEAYSEYFRQNKNGLKFWLNTIGTKADRVENELRRRGSFVSRNGRCR